MFRQALIVTSVLMLALALYLMQELVELAPYRGLIYERHGLSLALYAAMLFVNLLAGMHWCLRQLSLAETGRKLAHLEKQLRTGTSLSDELTDRLKDS